DEVAFDFHPGQWPLEFKAGLGEHRLEDVQAQLHLAPVLLSSCPVEGGPLELIAHIADATCSGTAAQAVGTAGVRPGGRIVSAANLRSPSSCGGMQLAEFIASIDQGTTSTRCMIFDHVCSEVGGH